MDDLEKKKWIITRGDITFNLRRQMIREKEQEIEQFRESEISRWKSVEKGIISALVSIFGIIVGLHEIYPNMLNWGTALLFISIVGFAVYLPCIIFRYINEKIFDDIVLSNTASRVWHHAYGYFTSCAIKIEQYNSKDFKKLLLYFDGVVMVSAELSLYNSLEKQDTWRKILFISMPAIKKISDTKKILKYLLDDTSKKYENARKEYESIPIIKNLLIYGNALSRYNSGIIIIPKLKLA